MLPNGMRVPLEIVRHPGGAAVVAIDAQDRVCLLRQYRHAAGGYIYELPAGKLEPDEPPEATARRELVEEASVSAAHWTSLGAYFSSPGVFTEVIHLYLATELAPATADPEAGRGVPGRMVAPGAGGRAGAQRGTRPTRKPSSGFCELQHAKKLRETAHRLRFATPEMLAMSNNYEGPSVILRP